MTPLHQITQPKPTRAKKLLSFAAARLFQAAIVPAIATLLLSCSPKQDTCPPAGPTFRVTISALNQSLPSQVTVTVKYGSGTETYDPDSPNTTPKVMYCDAYKTDGAVEGYDKLVCTLWTDGAATITVKAQSYPEFVRELAADRNDCGIVLKEEELTLEHTD